jgi:hypothetical protein
VGKRKNSDQKLPAAKKRKIMTIKNESSSNLDKEAMIAMAKLQARNSLGSEMISSQMTSTVPQELFSNDQSLDSTEYGEI